jgi:hypothetical protein
MPRCPGVGLDAHTRISIWLVQAIVLAEHDSARCPVAPVCAALELSYFEFVIACVAIAQVLVSGEVPAFQKVRVLAHD